MNLQFSDHIKTKMKLRNISEKLVKEIIQTSKEHFWDSETEYYIAVKTVELNIKKREVMVAYELFGDTIICITVHPLKVGQKDRRIQNNRWRKIQWKT